MQPDVTLEYEFLFSLVADIDAPQDIGGRQIYPILGGRIEGPTIKAEILPGGADWVTVREDGSAVLDVRATLQTDDGELVYVYYPGIVAPQGEGEQYWRTTPRFETASKKYGWLNNVIAVGVAKEVPGKVAYDVFAIL